MMESDAKLESSDGSGLLGRHRPLSMSPAKQGTEPSTLEAIVESVDLRLEVRLRQASF